MATLELVERLREYANVSYQEANDALNACNNDILDAIVYLEKQGKVNRKPSEPAYNAHFSTQNQSQQPKQSYQPPPKEETFGDLMGRFFRWLQDLIKKSMVNCFVVSRNGETQFSIPILVLLLCLVLSGGLAFVLIIVGMFFGYSYSFSGKNFSSENSVNDMMDAASRTTQDIKESIKNTQSNIEKREEERKQQKKASDDDVTHIDIE